MCGRFTISTPAAKLIELFQLTTFPRMDPRFNIAPSQLVVCIRLEETVREAVSTRWGLVPSWAKDVSIGNRMINARSETAAEKPAFRSAWKKRRCLIPVDGFFEWEKLRGRRKQPWLIHMQDHIPFAFGGLWESWQPKGSDDPPVLSCSILTTAANSEMSPIHDRMPVIISPEHHATWLSDDASTGQLTKLIEPLPPGLLQRYPVCDLVNKPSFDSKQCLEPLQNNDAPDAQQMSLFNDDD